LKQYTTKCKYTLKPFKRLSNFDLVLNHILDMSSLSQSILYEEFHSCDFTKNKWMKFFIQTSVSVWIYKKFFEKTLSFER
jgi:hypothetical protein